MAAIGRITMSPSPDEGKGTRMGDLWNSSEKLALLIAAANWGIALTLLTAFACTVVTIKAGGRKDEIADAESLEKKAQIAQLGKDTEQLKSGNIQLRIDLETEKQNTARFQVEAETARLALEREVQKQGPRAKLLVSAAPGLVKQLEPFAGQRVGLFVCGEQGAADQETIDSWAAIANILGTGTVAGVAGAKWDILSPNLGFTQGCGAAKGLGQGIMVFVSKHASRRTMEAADLLGSGLSVALPASRNKMPRLIDPDFTKLTIDRGLQDRSAPWVSVGLDPDLITVLIGAHP
jgi:hypothetical protein